MDIVLPKPGKYVMAVSGGVDSMALLDILSKQVGIDLIVAHLDHGIREDSAEDYKLVESVASTLHVPFVGLKAKLGKNTSEARARSARYKFLRDVMKNHQAAAIITAHHQDDLIETAILNMLRGTGRKGLTSLGSGEDISRPLLGVSKAELRAYARMYTLKWREDSTNSDESYLRNYVRHNLVTKLDPPARQKFIKIIETMRETNDQLDTLLVKHLRLQSVDGEIRRQWFNQLPHEVAREVMASWLRGNGIRDFDSKALERLVVAAKTAAVGKVFPVLAGSSLKVNKTNLALTVPER